MCQFGQLAQVLQALVALAQQVVQRLAREQDLVAGRNVRPWRQLERTCVVVQGLVVGKAGCGSVTRLAQVVRCPIVDLRLDIVMGQLRGKRLQLPGMVRFEVTGESAMQLNACGMDDAAVRDLDRKSVV